ncbi:MULTISPECIES: hypothetical protein [unclassified Streptomyces]|uniref:hypothetical protein n=1 Tax=unclassified Streptomyces TaxID=2593676 RepID=UPI0006AE1CD3|nr:MULTISPECIES: hypothetical protein [unclassified Streptomyces]KOX27689.1 hypothetical protein ADL06_14430 [Streptomyces sp. NRRL F-6491]KOX36300.1 hypothetical protein ADL08_32660 [Streptomyces sp. NRRL F-6492]
MDDEASRTSRDPLAEHPCPACGGPRATLATRHKVLGAWVPEWTVQPCRDPECRLSEEHEGAGHGATGNKGAGHGGAEAATPHVTGKGAETGRSPAPG